MGKVKINTVEDFKTRIKSYSNSFNSLSLYEIRENEDDFFDFIQSNYIGYFVGALKVFMGESFTAPHDFSNSNGVRDFCNSELVEKIYKQKIFAFHFDESKGKPEAFLATVLKNELLDLIKKNRRKNYFETVELLSENENFEGRFGDSQEQQPQITDFKIFAKKFPLLLDEAPTALSEKLNLFICHPLVGAFSQYNNLGQSTEEKERIVLWRKYSEF